MIFYTHTFLHKINISVGKVNIVDYLPNTSPLLYFFIAEKAPVLFVCSSTIVLCSEKMILSLSSGMNKDCYWLIILITFHVSWLA